MKSIACVLLGVVLGGYVVPKALCWHWHRTGVLPAAAKESAYIPNK